MANPRVLCLGEILFDLISDQPGRPLEEVTSWTPYPGGAPANVACGLVKLGTTTGFIGCVGNDQPGETLVELLRTTGVDITGIQRHETAPTRQIYVVRTAEGDRQFAGFGDYDPAKFADAFLQAAGMPTDLFDAADFLVLGTLEMAYAETGQAIGRSLELAEQHYMKILMDVNWRPMFWDDPNGAKSIILDSVKRVDFLKLSDEEALWLFGTPDPGVITHRVENLEGVLVTAGEHGCAYCLGNNEGKLPAFSVEVEETTGAGDGFLAGFIHQVCQTGLQALEDPDVARTVITYASAVGALTTTRPGAIAAQPSAAEVEAFLYLNAKTASD